MSFPFKKVTFSTIAILIAVLLTEGVIRLTEFKAPETPYIVFDKFNSNPERRMARTGTDYGGNASIIYLTDDLTFWKFKPSSKANLDPDKMLWKSPTLYNINSHGFRGDEFTIKKEPGTIRIIAIGDSVTFGLLVPKDKTYWKLLERKLNQILAPLKFEVISAGVPGYTSYQGLQLLKHELLSYSPDIIVSYFGNSNEFYPHTYTDREYADKIKESLLQKLSQKSLTVGFLVSVVQKIKTLAPAPSQNQDTMDVTSRVPLDDFMEDLTEIVDVTKKSGGIPILVVPPHSSNESPTADRYGSVVRSLSNSALIADTDSQFEKLGRDSLFSEDYIHPNEAGHQVIADTIYEILIKEIKKY